MAVPGKFTPVQRNVPPQGPPPQTKGKSPAMPIILLIIYAAYLGLMIIGPKFVSQLADELDPIVAPFLRWIGAGILFLVFAIMIMYSLLSKPKPAARQTPRPQQQAIVKAQAKPPGAAPPSKFKPITVKATEKKEKPLPPVKKVEDEKARSQMIIYPVEVEGGIFGDTYIQLGQKKVLKLRSMVVEPEYLS